MHRIYNQMCEPKWVISMGSASTGGVFDTYAVVQVWINSFPLTCTSGCPPGPEMLIEGVMAICASSMATSHRWQRKRIPLNLALEPTMNPPPNRWTSASACPESNSSRLRGPARLVLHVQW